MTEYLLGKVEDFPEGKGRAFRAGTRTVAVFRVNGFTGGRLPNREDIRQIRFRTNSFAADNHDAGRVQVEIITRPNVQAWNGNLNANIRNDIFNARDAFAATKTPQNIARIGGGMRGPIIARKTSLRLNVERNESNTAANIYALTPEGGPLLGFVSSPSHNTFGTIGIDGRYVLATEGASGVAPGKHRVTVMGPDGWRLPDKFLDPQASGLRAEVLAGRANLFEFKLEDR